MSQHKGVLWTRRQFALTAVSAIPVACVARSWSPSDADSHRRLALANLHTGEELAVSFHPNDMAPRDAAALRHLLRDYRVNEEHEMDFGLFLQLTDLARQAAVPAVFEVISGYRSPGTNASLRANGHHVAEHSQHVLGRAMDVRLRDCSLSKLHDLALSAQRGGVGYYPRSNFVHIDTGRVRSWQE